MIPRYRQSNIGRIESIFTEAALKNRDICSTTHTRVDGGSKCICVETEKTILSLRAVPAIAQETFEYQ